jgi:site-specific recombinase XerD
VKGVKKMGVRLGNWLLPDQAIALLDAPNPEVMKGKRDLALLAILVACGLRRHEAVELNVLHLQQREDHWAIVDLIGKAAHIRTIPVADWVKELIDDWLHSAGMSSGRIFRRVTRARTVWGNGLSEKVVWHVVRQYARKVGIEKLAPHDLRRTCTRLCHDAGGELDQIQFLLGHVSVQKANDILAASSGSAMPSTTESASSRTPERFRSVIDEWPTMPQREVNAVHMPQHPMSEIVLPSSLM